MNINMRATNVVFFVASLKQYTLFLFCSFTSTLAPAIGYGPTPPHDYNSMSTTHINLKPVTLKNGKTFHDWQYMLKGALLRSIQLYYHPNLW
jgi:hypothetical protein